MTHTHVQLSNVVYNAGTQCFEALATVTVDGFAKTHPCAIEAPITMTFSRAAEGLKTQALRNSKLGTEISSHMRQHVADVRAGRLRFNPRTWLAQLGFSSLDNAA